MKIAVIILRGEKIEGLIGLESLNKVVCLIEAESDEGKFFALPFLQTGKRI